MTTTPPDHVLVPRVGTTVSIVGHPQGPFIVYERKVDEYLPHSICVRGENTAWFAVELLAPSPPTSGGVNAGLLEAARHLAEAKRLCGGDLALRDIRESVELAELAIDSMRCDKQAISTAESAQAATAGDDDEGDFVSCESCDNARVPHEDAISAGDGYLCPKCHAEWRKEFETCEHDWHPHQDEYGDECRICPKCSGIDYPDAAKTPTIAAGDDLAWLDEIGARVKATTQTRWRAMRDGNQYVYVELDPRAGKNTVHPSGRGNLVGASKIEGLQRPWNPWWVGDSTSPETQETVRLRDEDADFIENSREDILRLTAALRQALSRHKDDAGKVTEAMVERALGKYWDAKGVSYSDLSSEKQNLLYMRAALQAALAPTEGK